MIWSEWKYEHPNHHDTKSWLETKGCTPTADTHRSFFVKKGKKFNSLSNNLYGLPGVGKITTSSLSFFVSLC